VADPRSVTDLKQEFGLIGFERVLGRADGCGRGEWADEREASAGAGIPT
jgi:hypothetical protein